jgi:hypothetical protein
MSGFSITPISSFLGAVRAARMYCNRERDEMRHRMQGP